MNALVLQGIPFRDAYQQIGKAIEEQRFFPDQKKVMHSHEGSIGNLCLPEIQSKISKKVAEFDFQKIEKAISKLLK